MENLANILAESGLPEEMVSSLQEAFDKKVVEAREEAELSIREEFAARYEHDKATFVEAMNRMLTDVVQKSEESKAAEIANLKESQAQLAKAVKEARSHYRTKLAESVGVANTFITQQLSKSITRLNEQKKALSTKQSKLDEQFEAVKSDVTTQHAARLAKIDEFVVRQVKRELSELQADHRALVETRVKFVAESKKKLSETQKKFVKESANKVEAMINETMKREMTQLHEDLERNRQNNFGRRIFEAVAAEFMTSYLAEGTEIRNLQTMLESKDQELNTVKSKLSEAATAVDAIARKVKLAEDRANRTKVMTELLSNLRGEKRSVMESMLETVKTESLRGQFDKLLPVVLNENARRPLQNKTVLSETKSPVRRVITGDKTNRLAESAQIETEVEMEASSDIATVLRLAGLK
ncbi:MAG: hypothetical protein EOP83_14920 [Verrucomicrobiaceae bacterium]|nr:MAG: hypothetical protein EOP83_14920 [Verrucomicrobiaceae bacterium]